VRRFSPSTRQSKSSLLSNHLVITRVISIRYFRSVFGRYFSVFTIPIPKENSVNTFRYKKGGSAPLFPQKGGNGPLFEKLDPFWKKGGRRGEVYKKGGDRYRPKYRKSSKSDTGKILIPKKLLVTPRYTTLVITSDNIRLFSSFC
jgi:hypothetical protein